MILFGKSAEPNILAMIEDKGISDIKDIFSGQMQLEYFPVLLERMGQNSTL